MEYGRSGKPGVPRLVDELQMRGDSLGGFRVDVHELINQYTLIVTALCWILRPRFSIESVMSLVSTTPSTERHALSIIERLVVDQPRKQDSPDQIVCSYDRKDGSPRVIRFLNGPTSPGADEATKGTWIGDEPA